MANRNRPIQVKFRVTPEERACIFAFFINSEFRKVSNDFGANFFTAHFSKTLLVATLELMYSEIFL